MRKLNDNKNSDSGNHGRSTMEKTKSKIPVDRRCRSLPVYRVDGIFFLRSSPASSFSKNYIIALPILAVAVFIPHRYTIHIRINDNICI